MNNLKKPLVILEVANNHMGDYSHFRKIIEKFYKLKLKYKKINFAIKFQYRDLDTFIHGSYKNTENKFVKRFEDTSLKKIEWKKILKISKSKFITICTAFDEISVQNVVDQKFDMLKIASCSMNDWPLLEVIAKKYKKKIICSLGGATETEITRCINFFLNHKKNISFLYCVGRYPSNYEDQNFEYFKYLKNLFGDCIKGYSSHETSDSFLSGAIAYGAGARIFEKHVGIETKKFSLNKYSWDVKSLEKWLNKLEYAIDFCGTINSRNKLLYKEKKDIKNFKRGIFLKNIAGKLKGQSLLQKDVYAAFPCEKNQLTTFDMSKFNDYTIKKNIKKDQPIFFKDVKIINQNYKLEKIRSDVKSLIRKSKVFVNQKSKIEISHHYGLENFYKFGSCMITVYNNKYCKKLIFLLPKQKHPEQYHKIKNETFHVIYGKIYITLDGVKKILNQGDIITIKPYSKHLFGCLSNIGAIIEELSSESSPKDSFYIDTKINKNPSRKSFININYSFS